MTEYQKKGFFAETDEADFVDIPTEEITDEGQKDKRVIADERFNTVYIPLKSDIHWYKVRMIALQTTNWSLKLASRFVPVIIICISVFFVVKIAWHGLQLLTKAVLNGFVAAMPMIESATATIASIFITFAVLIFTAIIIFLLLRESIGVLKTNNVQGNRRGYEGYKKSIEIEQKIKIKL